MIRIVFLILHARNITDPYQTACYVPASRNRHHKKEIWIFIKKIG